jgi:glutathione S-transferase
MYTLHCFGQSGNAFKAAFMLQALGAPWRPQYVDFFNGLSRTPEWRAETNEMGELPVLEDGATRLTQSGVILTYLAAKHGRFGGRDERERLEVLRWLLFDNHKFTSFFAIYRFMKSFAPVAPDPAVLKFLAGRIEGAFGIVEAHLQRRPFMIGDQPTIADFSMSAYQFYPPEESDHLVAGRFPAIEAWLARLRAVPGWGDPYDLMPGSRIAPRW